MSFATTTKLNPESIAEHIEIALGDDVRTFSSRRGERLLHAGLRSGVDLPYECATGTCGSCKARRMEGNVEDLWPEAAGRKYLRGPDEILLCQCAAVTSCRFRIHPGGQTPIPQTRPDSGWGVVRGARRLAPDVLTFNVETRRSINFDAGQFMCLQFAHEPGFRSYSMVNYERGANSLEFVVKRKPGGRLTPWLFDNCIDGKDVEWFGPLGHAIFQPGPQDLLCIAGGTGIAGMMSIFRCALTSGHFAHSKGYVFFGVRTRHDAFYLDELSELVSASEGAIEVTVALSEEAAPNADCQVQYRKGLVHEVAKVAMAGHYQNVMAYIAGPPPAVDASLRVLLAARVPTRNIRFDKFS